MWTLLLNFLKDVRINITTIVVIIIVLFLAKKGCEYQQNKADRRIEAYQDSLSIARGQSARKDTLINSLIAQVNTSKGNRIVEIKYRDIIKIKHDSLVDTIIKTERIYLPPESDLSVSVDTSGKVHLSYRKWGFCFRPFLMGGLGINDWFVGLGIRFAFWNRWGLYGGLTSFHRERLGTPIGIDYRLDKFSFLSNSRMGINYDIKNRAIGVDFGVFF